jgi:hypothetical protein
MRYIAEVSDRFTPFGESNQPTAAHVGGIMGRIECALGEPRVSIRLSGSRFPRHRVFVNGVLRPPAIAQGPFKNLWVPAGISDPTLVR